MNHLIIIIFIINITNIIMMMMIRIIIIIINNINKNNKSGNPNDNDATLRLMTSQTRRGISWSLASRRIRRGSSTAPFPPK